MDKLKNSKDAIKYSIYLDFGLSIVIALLGILCYFIKTTDTGLKFISFGIYVISALSGVVGYLIYKYHKFEVYKGSIIYAVASLLIALHLLINPFKMDKILVFSCGLWLFVTALIVLDYFFYYKHKKESFANIIGIITAIMAVVSLIVLYNVFWDIQFGKTIWVITFKDTLCISFVLFGGLKAIVNKLIMKEKN